MNARGIFKQKYGELKGRDWARRLEPDDRKVLSEIGQEAHMYGYLGGKARAQTARRVNGKFTRADGSFTPYEKREQEINDLHAEFQDIANNHRQVADAMDRVSQALGMIGEFAVIMRGRV